MASDHHRQTEAAVHLDTIEIFPSHRLHFRALLEAAFLQLAKQREKVFAHRLGFFGSRLPQYVPKQLAAAIGELIFSFKPWSGAA